MIQDTKTEHQLLLYIVSSGQIPNNLRSLDFSTHSTRNIFEVCSRIISEKLAMTPEIIASYFPEQERDGVIHYCSEFSPPNFDLVEGFVRHLQKVTERRHIESAAGEAFTEIKNPAKSGDDVLHKLESDLISIPRINDVRQEIIPPQEYLEWRKKQLMERRKSNNAFIGTGIPELDEDLVDGFTVPWIGIICGFSSMGKTLISMKAARHIASRLGHDEEVLYFAAESGNDKISDRYDTQITGISMKELQNVSQWQASDPRWKMLKNSAIEQAGWRLHRLDVRGLSAVKLMDMVREYKKTYPNIKVIFVDTVQDLNENINWNDEGSGTQNNSIEKMLHTFEVKAKEYGVHVCLISQLSRPKETIKIYRPRTEWLRGSDAYVAKATWILNVYRPFILQGGEADNEFHIWIMKNRDGPRMIKYIFEFWGSQFEIGNFIGKDFN